MGERGPGEGEAGVSGQHVVVTAGLASASAQVRAPEAEEDQAQPESGDEEQGQ